MASPKISVIIPIYDVEKYLPACLNSVLAQTFTDFEAICVNDGSPDNAAAILKEYAARDSRIKVVTQPNGGLSAARNAGLEQAQGDYVYFLDSDDYIHPQILEILYREISGGEFDFAACRFQNVKDAAVSFPEYQSYGTILVKEPLAELFQKKKRLSINVWSKLYLRKTLGDLRFIPGLIYEDLPFTCAYMERSRSGKIVDLPLYYYLQREGSLSGKQEIKLKNCESYIFILRSLHKKFHGGPLEAGMRRCFFRSILKTLLKRKKCRPAKDYLQKELRKLLAENIISWNDLPLRYKVKLWLFLHNL